MTPLELLENDATIWNISLEASITILEASLFTIQGTVMIVTYDHNLRLQYVYSTGHWS